MHPKSYSCSWKYKLVKGKKRDRYLLLISLLMWSVNEVEVLETAPSYKCFAPNDAIECMCLHMLSTSVISIWKWYFPSDLSMYLILKILLLFWCRFKISNESIYIIIINTSFKYFDNYLKVEPNEKSIYLSK